MKHVKCTSSFFIDVDAERALELFTPEGERLWGGDGWDPRYPAELEPGASGAEPGTVFQTGDEASPTIWVAVGKRDGRVSYARVVPGSAAGVVSVLCTAAAGGTEVEVTYETTALSEGATCELDEFARGYAHFIASWKDELEASAVVTST